MDEPEEQRHPVVGPEMPADDVVPVIKVITTGKNDGERDQKFDQLCVQRHDIQHAQRQCDRMPDGESGDEHEQAFPLFGRVHGTKRDEKKNVIRTLDVGDVLYAVDEPQGEVAQILYF